MADALSVSHSKMLASLATALAAAVLLARTPSFAADANLVLDTSRWVISGEVTVAQFGARLNDRGIQAWNVSARFSLLPFGVTHFHILKGILDGALEVGLEPTFERFAVQHQNSPRARFDVQYPTGPIFPSGHTSSYAASSGVDPGGPAGFSNFAGVGLVLRYYLLHFCYGPLVPWIEAGIAPGGTDLKIGQESNRTRLTGPFMNRIKAGVGASYFISEHVAAYAGLQAQHISNAGLNGSNRNYSLNTAVSFTVGASWFLR